MGNEYIWSFLHISLTTSFVIALLLLAVPLLRKSYQAKWRYYAWLVIALRLLIPLNMALSKAPIQIQVPDTAIIKVNRLERPITDQALPVPDESYITAQPDTQAAREVSPAQIVMVVWMSGAALFILLQVTAYIRFCRRIRYCPRTEPSALMQSVWIASVELLGKRRTPELQISAAVPSPVITGLIKPVLFLPHDRYSEQELNFIFLHELVHYQRRDLWYKLILTIANGLHWFNPLIYLMVARAGMDIEISCDDQVVKGLDESARAIYGEAILDALPIKTKWSIEPMLTTSFSRTKRTIKQRLTNLFDQTHKRKGIVTFCAMLLVTGLIGGLITYTPVAAASITNAKVINLPQELKIPANILNTGATYYNFTVEKSTELAVDITTESGTIILGIYRYVDITRSRDTMTLCLSVRNTEAEGDSVILEPGYYTAKVEAAQFTGEYRIFGSERKSGTLSNSLNSMATVKIGSETWYLVETEAQLRSIAQSDATLSRNYLQNADIVLENDWVSIGSDEHPFTGSYNGNGFTIVGLRYPVGEKKYTGLFGYAEGAKIYNVTLARLDTTNANGLHSGAVVAISIDGSSFDNTILSDEQFKPQESALPNALVESYYLSANDPVYSYLQNNSIKKFLDMWFAEDIDKNAKPQWNYDTLAPVQILDHDFVSLTRPGVQLYTMTFSAAGGRCGYILLSYSAEGPSIQKWSLTETTPYLYDLRANSDRIAASLKETNLDLSTATAKRIEWQDTKRNRGDRAILFQDSKGNRYICYLGNNDFIMEKA